MTPAEMYEANVNGESCADIARRLGVSKASVIGRVFRHRRKNKLPPSMTRSDAAKLGGLAARGKPRAAYERKYKGDAFTRTLGDALKPAGSKAVHTRKKGGAHRHAKRDQVSEIRGGGDALAKVRHNECKWPIGDPGAKNFRFCRQPRHAHNPYCLHHQRIAVIVISKDDTVAA